jgi:hypothetical protein
MQPLQRRRAAATRTLWALGFIPPVLAFLWLSSGCSLLFKAPDPKNAQRCLCTCRLPERETLHQIQVGADDGREASDGTVFLGGNALPFGRHMVGVRFPDLQIPRGATIDRAHVQFTASSSDSSATEVVIHVIRSNEPFENVSGNLSSRIPEPPPGAPDPLTVPWAIDPWTSDEAGLAQRTPDLRDLVAREVGDPWQPGDVLVVLFAVPDDTGTRFAHAFEGDPERAAVLEVTFRAAVQQTLSLCMPDDLNPNLAPGGVPNENPAPITQVADYCSARVASTLAGLGSRCFDMTDCTCILDPDPKTRTFTHAPCDLPCFERELSGDCAEFDPLADLAGTTNAPGDEPVCLAEGNPDDPTPTALSRGVFGRRSECVAVGTAEVEVEGRSDARPMRSFIAIEGGPCPGESCEIGVAHVSVANEAFEFGGLLGFGVTRIEDVIASGASPPRRAGLDASGEGVFAAGELLSTVRGQRSSEADAEAAAFEGANPEPFGVRVDWESAQCALEGSIAAELEDGEETVDVFVQLALAGVVTNRPPEAVAAANGSVECTSPEGAEVALDGSASSDPDGNLVELSWRAGDRMGPEVATGALASVLQGPGSQTYVLRAFDARGQIDEDAVEVVVEDTTPPEIACNAPATIFPPDAPIAFTADASDACDPGVVAEITGVACFEMKRDGRRVDKSNSCVIAVDGGTLHILDSGGVNTHIRWDVRAVDASGNAAERECGIVVVRP